MLKEKTENILGEENMTSDEEKTVLETLTTKIDELNKIIKDKNVQTTEKMKEHPLSYVTGAFIGGLFIGFLIGKGKK